MASFYGYIIMIVGLSLLLGMAGIATNGGALITKFLQINGGAGIGNYSVTGGELLNAYQNTFIATIIGILAGLLVISPSALALRFDLGGVLKLGFGATIIGLCIGDLWAVISAAQKIDNFNGLIYLISIVVYVPILIGYIVTLFNWIGGSN